jgi:RNA polymerase subunit RPABC4/transcription elongation factor Spt4
MKKPEVPKSAFAFRLDPEDVTIARKMGIDLSSLFRSALKESISVKKCPTCGHRVKSK